MGLMGIVPLLLIGLLVWLVIEATRGRDRRDETRVTYASLPPARDVSSPHVSAQGGTASHDRALTILEERYARGEIEREDYLQRRRDLEG